MNYRIVRITHISYTVILQSLYRANPGLDKMPFDRQMDKIMGLMSCYSDWFSREMRAIGNEAHELVFNAVSAQKTWADEHDVKYDDKTWQTDILLAQIDSIKPDVVYFQAMCPFPPMIMTYFRRIFPFVKFIALYMRFPRGRKEYSHMDTVFIGAPYVRKRVEDIGIPTHLVYHCFDEKVLERLGPVDGDPQYDFSFLGTSGYFIGKEFDRPFLPTHEDRFWMLEELMRKTKLQVWENVINTEDQSIQDAPRKVKSLQEMFPDKCFDAVYGLDMYRHLARTKITLSHHNELEKDDLGNMRMFEATGAGTLLLTDKGANLPDLFDENTEVVTYSSVDEIVEKVKYLLDHEEERKRIAEAGQRRTLKDHTAKQRVEKINAIIMDALKNK